MSLQRIVMGVIYVCHSHAKEQTLVMAVLNEDEFF